MNIRYPLRGSLSNTYHYSYYDYLLFFNVNITIKSLIIK